MICRILGVSVLILASALAHSVQASKTTNPFRRTISAGTNPTRFWYQGSTSKPERRKF